MSTGTVTMVVILIAIALGFLAWMYVRNRRTQQLRSKFGPEYDRLTNEYGNPRKAEAELANRQQRVEKFHIRELTAAECERYATAWRVEQERFVDNPSQAVANADRVVGELMQEKGYPVGDFEQRAADISVEHPGVVTEYRAAHEIAVLDSGGKATTEDLRKAMVHFRSLFEDLLGRHVTEPGRRVNELEEVRR